MMSKQKLFAKHYDSKSVSPQDAACLRYSAGPSCIRINMKENLEEKMDTINSIEGVQ
jgi:hypothetical protein